MPFTEFYCNAATGAQINAGDLTANGVVTSTNGDWGNAAANRFTAAAGTPFSGVSVGDFASVYLDGATVAVYIGRVTAVNAGGASLDISATAKMGTAPSTGATGRSCTTGGAWKGPNAADGFPFTLIGLTLTNAAADQPRVNMKNGTTYAITAAITTTANGPWTIEGYTTTVGDGGRFILDGTSAGASFVLFTNASDNTRIVGGIFQNNGASGSANGVLANGGRQHWLNCVFNSVRGNGLSTTTTGFNVFEGCEAYACNQSNTAAFAGFNAGIANTRYIRCIAHDNTGSNTSGFFTNVTYVSFDHCIADTNGLYGFSVSTAPITVWFYSCDAYANVNDGIRLANTAAMMCVIENCNFIGNGTGGTGYGINGSGAAMRTGMVRNCGFGAGTAANTTGTVNSLKGMTESGSVTYASNVTPWVDPANGDFRINLAAAKNAGYGVFTETASSYSGAVGFPDIGAAQHLDVPGMLFTPNLEGT